MGQTLAKEHIEKKKQVRSRTTNCDYAIVNSRLKQSRQYNQIVTTNISNGARRATNLRFSTNLFLKLVDKALFVLVIEQDE